MTLNVWESVGRVLLHATPYQVNGFLAAIKAGQGYLFRVHFVSPTLALVFYSDDTSVSRNSGGCQMDFPKKSRNTSLWW
jgi:hypothetical protein